MLRHCTGTQLVFIMPLEGNCSQPLAFLNEEIKAESSLAAVPKLQRNQVPSPRAWQATQKNRMLLLPQLPSWDSRQQPMHWARFLLDVNPGEVII